MSEFGENLDDEIAVKWKLLPGEVLLNGKPARSAAVAKALREAGERSKREVLAFKRQFLRSIETREALLDPDPKRAKNAYVTVLHLMDSLEHYAKTGRDFP
jgi:hypothetical protein